MSNYEEQADAMWEEIEGKPKKEKQKKEKKLTEREKFDRCVSECEGALVITEFGELDLSRDAMKDIKRGENLSWEDYLDALFNSRNNRRTAFEYSYYGQYPCDYYGRIEKIDAKKNKILFSRIAISGDFMDGTCFEDKEDHVWMELAPFRGYEVGECVGFTADIYRYLKTRNGLQISFGLKNPDFIKRVDSYRVPTDEELQKQSIDRLICEVCMYNEHCNFVACLANDEWREQMRAMLSVGLAGKPAHDDGDDDI